MTGRYDEIYLSAVSTDVNGTEPARSGRSGRRALALTVALGALAAVSWSVIGTQDDTPDEELPLVRADGPIRQRPKDPGGIQVPHQEVGVYNLLGQKKAEPGAGGEVLLRQPEAPVPVPSTPAASPDGARNPESLLGETGAATSAPHGSPSTAFSAPPIPAANLSSDIPTGAAPVSPDGAPAPARKPIDLTLPADDLAEGRAAVGQKTALAAMAAPSQPAVSAKISPPGAAAPSAAAQPAAARPAAPPAGAAAAGKGSWWVQLASLPGGKGRDAEVVRLKRKHRDLGGLSFRIVGVRLATGAYERIQAGPFDGRDGAKQMCAALAKLKQPCIVVGP
jgi:hypothetical protein